MSDPRDHCHYNYAREPGREHWGLCWSDIGTHDPKQDPPLHMDHEFVPMPEGGTEAAYENEAS